MSRSTAVRLNRERSRHRRSLSMLASLHGFQDLRDRRGESAPRARLRIEPGAAFLRQLVVLRAAVVVGGAPARLDPAAALEPMKRRVERALLDVERRAGDLMEAFGDRPTVLRVERDGLQNEEVEGALWKLEPFVTHSISPLVLRQETTSYSCRSARGRSYWKIASDRG